MYRVGWPGWKLASRLGVPLLVRVQIHHDRDAHMYWANSPDLDGLVVSGATLDELKTEAVSACNALLALQRRNEVVHVVVHLSGAGFPDSIARLDPVA